MPGTCSKGRGRKEKGKALSPPVLQPVDQEVAPPVDPEAPPPVDLEAAHEEVDKTTYAKSKRKKVQTTFTEQQKEEIIDFLIQHEVLYSKRFSGFRDGNKKRIPLVIVSRSAKHSIF